MEARSRGGIVCGDAVKNRREIIRQENDLRQKDNNTEKTRKESRDGELQGGSTCKDLGTRGKNIFKPGELDFGGSAGKGGALLKVGCKKRSETN